MTPASAYATSYRDGTGDWREAAACRGDETDLWFPYSSESGQAELAKQICRGCPSRQPCLRWALDNRVPYGIFGGLDEDERARMLRREQWRDYRRRQKGRLE